MPAWLPSASLDTLRLRARLLAQTRAFFYARGVWEVETPLLSQAATPDPHIHSFAVSASTGAEPRYLHTSPEFPMKRLLAAGSGSIYQICKVFREGEVGRRHNPEFTLLEWYRIGFDLPALMEEVDILIRELLREGDSECLALGDTQYFSYTEALQRFSGLDEPLNADITVLQNCARSHGLDVPALGDEHDAWLDLLMSHVVEPALPRDCPVFIYDYPVSQAALAQIRGDVAERFELYLNGMELANGFHELADAAEQRQRFEAENQRRLQMGLPVMPLDTHFLTALEQGLPDCSGVALGFDRLLMLIAGKTDIAAVLSFACERA
ncbi:Translation elongation factor P Lys34--(R)-beta-lysine ligase [hydrothermal vent metagenome]|uniref:Translation elongation factor P Lys34--(R)-beta-lysine ligase n=1 Tax=hydrothermal vent metagenome TaxID=652676 RepID=A0A3B1B252_9ZZZZ